MPEPPDPSGDRVPADPRDHLPGGAAHQGRAPAVSGYLSDRGTARAAEADLRHAGPRPVSRTRLQPQTTGREDLPLDRATQAIGPVAATGDNSPGTWATEAL